MKELFFPTEVLHQIAARPPFKGGKCFGGDGWILFLEICLDPEHFTRSVGAVSALSEDEDAGAPVFNRHACNKTNGQASANLTCVIRKQ